MTGKKKGRGSDIGPVLGDDAKEAAAFARDAKSGVIVATDRRDIGPKPALQASWIPQVGADGRLMPRGRLLPAKRVIERLTREVDGAAVEVHMVVSTLKALYKNGTITEEQFAIGCEFKTKFDQARFDALRSSDMGRLSGGASRGEESGVQVDARNYIHRCFKILGGDGMMTSRALWHIVGMELSFRDMQGNDGRDQKFWSTALVIALDTLVANMRRGEKNIRA